MKKWIPKQGGIFYCFDEYLEVCADPWNGHFSSHIRLLNIGNCFRTKKQCCEAIRKIKKMLKEGREI
jgi:hypothetical protein